MSIRLILTPITFLTFSCSVMPSKNHGGGADSSKNLTEVASGEGLNGTEAQFDSCAPENFQRLLDEVILPKLDKEGDNSAKSVDPNDCRVLATKTTASDGTERRCRWNENALTCSEWNPDHSDGSAPFVDISLTRYQSTERFIEEGRALGLTTAKEGLWQHKWIDTNDEADEYGPIWSRPDYMFSGSIKYEYEDDAQTTVVNFGREGQSGSAHIEDMSKVLRSDTLKRPRLLLEQRFIGRVPWAKDSISCSLQTKTYFPDHIVTKDYVISSDPENFGRYSSTSEYFDERGLLTKIETQSEDYKWVTTIAIEATADVCK